MSNERNETKTVTAEDLVNVVGGGLDAAPGGDVRVEPESVVINGAPQRGAIETAPIKGPNPLPPGFPKPKIFWF
jgi:hypothetical protein